MIYPYAVLAAPPVGALGAGLAGEPLLVLGCAGLLVIAGEIEAAPAVAPDTLRGHDAVLTRLMDLADAIVPLRFGQTVDGAAALDDLAAPLAPRWRETLARVAGCAQMTVRVWGEAPEAPAVTGGEGTRYLTARARAARLPELDPVRALVAAHVRAERTQRGQGGLFATLYHLVPRSSEAAYREALAAAELGAWRIAVTGPFAPYAFALEGEA